MRDGFPLLLVNGVDVAAAASAVLPEIGNRGDVSFGALMASEGKIPFSVSFDEIGALRAGVIHDPRVVHGCLTRSRRTS